MGSDRVQSYHPVWEEEPEVVPVARDQPKLIGLENLSVVLPDSIGTPLQDTDPNLSRRGLQEADRLARGQSANPGEDVKGLIVELSRFFRNALVVIDVRVVQVSLGHEEARLRDA